MTPPVIQRWIEIIDGDLTDELAAILAEDCVFYSPAVFTPQEGRAKAVKYLTAASKMFAGNDFHYVGQWFAESSAILEFAAMIDGIYVNGIDMIHWNDEHLITSFKVMMRPLKGLHVIMPKMAELLQTT